MLGPGLGRHERQTASDIFGETPVAHSESKHTFEERSVEDDHTRLYHTDAASADARPIVGQEAVLQAVQQNVMRAFATHGVTLTFIEGGPGMGRTRLLERTSELVARQWFGSRVVYGACRNRDEGPYAPFSRCLLERFGVTPASSPNAVRRDMLSTVSEVLGGASARESEEVTQLLGHLAGVPFPGSTVLASLEHTPADLLERASAALRRFIEGDACGRPTLLLLDDMGRAENDAWHVLEQLLRADASLAIVVTGDDSVAPRIAKLATAAHTVVTRIRPLGDAEVSELVMALLPGLIATPESFVAALRHRSRGSPSALRELIRALEQHRLFKATKDGLEVDLGRFESGDLPLTMADAIRARLSALDPFEATVIQWAAVVGEMFWDGALLAIARSEAPELMRGKDPILRWTQADDDARITNALESLAQKRFLVRIAQSQVPGLSEYTFHVTGTRSVVYNELPEEVRRTRHAIVARWVTLSARLPEQDTAAILGQHLEHAGRPIAASRAYLKAAAGERSRLRTTMALRYAERALALATGHDTAARIEALHECGSLLTTLGRYDEAAGVFNEIVDLAWQLGARGTGGAALNRLARIHGQRGEHARALEYLRGALALFRSAEDERGVASTYDDLAQVHRTLGNLEPALAAAREALSIRRAGHDERGEAVSLTTLGFIELDRGDFDSARSHFDAALLIRERIGDHEGRIQTQIGLGLLAHYQGRTSDALALFQAALDSAREMNNRRFQSHLLNHLAETQLGLGQTEQAQTLLTEARTLAVSLRDQRALAAIEHNLGLLALQRSDPAAEQQLTAALSMAREYGTREAIALAYRGLGRMHARTLFDQTGRGLADAEASFREAIRIFVECGNVREAARTQAELGYHLIERGAGPRAKEALSEAYAAMKRFSLPDLARVTETLAQL